MKQLKSPAVITLSAMLLSLIAVGGARAQPAPIPRAVVPASTALETMSSMLAELESGDRTIRVEGAQWLQLQFSEFQLGDGGKLTIRSAADAQTFTQDQLDAWQGLSAIFNGSEVTVTLTPGASGEISAEVGEVIVGLPGPSPEGASGAVPQPLIDLLATDRRFIPADLPRQPDEPGPEGAADTESAAEVETICGSSDNRSASNHPASGRIMPIGCTGWIIQNGSLLTAGHCIDSRTQTVEFNVPASAGGGATVSPPVRDQYRVITSSIVDAYTGVGNDWAVFQVLPNTQTGLTPIAAQGSAFTSSNTASPSTVRITGFGVDGPPPRFGAPSPRNSDNQTQQTHNGTLTENSSGGANTGIVRYAVDTQGGNSGSPVMVEGTSTAIGIHTNGGCSASGGANAGTSFRNQALWAAAQAVPAPTIMLVDTNPRRLGDGDTTQVVATVTPALPGVAVSFSSSDIALATVSPATAITDSHGQARATVTSRTNSRSTAEITAEAGGQTARVTVRLPDLSMFGFGLMLLALFLFGTGRLRRPVA